LKDKKNISLATFTQSASATDGLS